MIGGESNVTRLSQLDELSVLCKLLLFAIQANVAYISNTPLLVGEHAFPLAEVLLLWIFYVFLSYVCYAFVRVCLYVLCGHLLGKG